MEENPYKAPVASIAPPGRPWWRITRLEFTVVAIVVALNLLIFLGLAIEMSAPPKQTQGHGQADRRAEKEPNEARRDGG